MLALHTYDDQVRRFAVELDAHATGAAEIAERVVEADAVLRTCRQRLALVQALSRDVARDLERIDRILSALERDQPDVDTAARWLEEDAWSSLVVPDCFARVPSFGFQQSIRGDDLVLALLSEEELASVRAHLARPAFQRLRWSKGDYLAVGACVTLGLAPIDYQGPGFGGGFHRARTRGHDLARFLEAIRQTAEGEFRGRRWSYGRPVEVITRLNQFGRAYPQMDWFAALVNVATHLFADFFSACSLLLPEEVPVPRGTTLVRRTARRIGAAGSSASRRLNRGSDG